MDSGEAINLLEVVLRDLIREVMGEGWLDYVDVNKLEGKRSAEAAKRRGIIATDDLIAYTEFFELKSIVLGNWALFEPALSKRKYFETYMDRLEGLRNSVMHSRTLLPFEEQLVQGIVGEIRNLVTIYRSTQGPDMKYYPQITEIVDSHGLRLTPDRETGITLRPGQLVTFRCSASDPHGRELSWKLTVPSRDHHREKVRSRATGDEVTLTWHVEEGDVRERSWIVIYLASTGPFHRHGFCDDSMEACYTVDPPLGG